MQCVYFLVLFQKSEQKKHSNYIFDVQNPELKKYAYFPIKLYAYHQVLN